MALVDSRARFAAAAAAVALQLLLGYALLVGLTVDVSPRIVAALRVFDIAPPSKPVVRPPPPRGRRAASRAAPPAQRARATPIVAPLPVLRIERPPLLVAAALPSIGTEASAGAAAAGPGSGAGGRGSGTGSGGAGTGDGGGGTPARWLRGRIKDADYPRAAREAGIGGDLTTRYTIDADGRVSDCTVIAPSGTAELDETTCRLVRERFRYAPRRDAAGRAVPDVVVESHHWVMEPPRPPGEAQR